MQNTIAFPNIKSANHLQRLICQIKLPPNIHLIRYVHMYVCISKMHIDIENEVSMHWYIDMYVSINKMFINVRKCIKTLKMTSVVEKSTVWVIAIFWIYAWEDLPLF